MGRGDERYAWIETTIGDETRRARVWYAAEGRPVAAVAVFSAGDRAPAWLDRFRRGARVRVVIGDERLDAAPRLVDPDSGEGDLWLSRLRAKYPRNVLGAGVEWAQPGHLVVLEVAGRGSAAT